MTGVDRETLAYIAGFFDGEGCVHIGGRRQNTTYNLEVTAANTNRDVLCFIQSSFDGSIRGREDPRGYKKVYTWRVVSNQASSFLEAILPFLKVKYERAELAIEFQKYKRQLPRGRPRGIGRPRWLIQIEDFCYEKMKEMNKKGTGE